MKKGILLLVCLIGMISCSKTENMFDTERVKEEAKENFPTQDIDPGHDWNMATVGTLTVSVNQNSSEVYTVKVYTANPFDEESGAKLMAKKEDVKDTQTISLTFDMPEAIQYVYVMLEDENNKHSVKIVDMKNPNPQVAWGGGNRSARNAVSRVSYAHSNDEDFQLPPNVSLYDYNWNNNKQNKFKLENYSPILYDFSKPIDLYITGKNVVVDADRTPTRIKIHILKGCMLTMKEGVKLNEGTVIYVAEGAALTTTNMSGAGTIYNRGTVNVSGNLTLSTSPTTTGTIVNESGAEFKVNGLTSITDSQASIENYGTFTTKRLSAQNGKMYTGCKFMVAEDADFRSLTFTQDGNTYFEAKTAIMYNTKVTLGTDAVFNVTGDMSFTSENSVINGVGTGDKTLFRVGGKCSYGANQPVVYTGNLQVAVKPYSASNGTEVIYKEPDEIKIGEIKDGECSPGYIEVGEGIKEEAQIYTYAFEDITIKGGDYDFNDIVLKVKTIPVDGKLEVTLVAAGATKDLEVYYNNSQLLFGGEVHAAMGCQPGEMINTGGGVVGKEVVDRSIVWQEGYTLKQNGNFSIRDVKENMWVKLPSFDDTFKAGDVPYAILVPDDWDFPAERHRVDEKYPNFVEWAKDATKEGDWYIKN